MTEVNTQHIFNDVQMALKRAEMAEPTNIPDFDVEVVAGDMMPVKPKPSNTSNHDLANMLAQDINGILGGIHGRGVQRSASTQNMSQMSDMEIHRHFMNQSEAEGGYNNASFMGDLSKQNLSPADRMHQQMTEMQNQYNNPSPELLLG